MIVLKNSSTALGWESKSLQEMQINTISYTESENNIYRIGSRWDLHILMIYFHLFRYGALCTYIQEKLLWDETLRNEIY